MLQYTNFKYCPKCASKELLAFESNAMKCITCGFVYFHNAASAVAAIIETSSGILVVKRNHDPKKGQLDVPGGFVNYNESLEDALRREIMEELSIELESVQYFGSFPNIYKFEQVTYFTTDIFFKCPLNSVPEINKNDEISEYVWFTPDNIPIEKFAFDSAKAAFTYYKSLI
jgi:NAD+ diphosphatase